MRPPPYYTPTDTLFPYPPVFRSPARASPRFSPSANPISRSHPKEMTMADAYIVEAVRTAGARRNGALAGWHPADMAGEVLNALVDRTGIDPARSEEHTSELQSLMRISYAVFCLKKKKTLNN